MDQMHNTYGDHFTLTVFGASHAEKIGVRISGLAAGTRIDRDELQAFMERRAPGRDRYSTAASRIRWYLKPALMRTER